METNHSLWVFYTLTRSFEECCWPTNVANNGNDQGSGRGWNMVSTIDITSRPDTGRPNSPPVSGSFPVYRMYRGCKYSRYIKGKNGCDSLYNFFISAKDWPELSNSVCQTQIRSPIFSHMASTLIPHNAMPQISYFQRSLNHIRK